MSRDGHRTVTVNAQNRLRPFRWFQVMVTGTVSVKYIQPKIQCLLTEIIKFFFRSFCGTGTRLTLTEKDQLIQALKKVRMMSTFLCGY
jgi:hypothetical protein